MRRTFSHGPGGLLRVVAVLLFAVTVSTPTMALAQSSATAGKTLTGAFDVGPSAKVRSVTAVARYGSAP